MIYDVEIKICVTESEEDDEASIVFPHTFVNGNEKMPIFDIAIEIAKAEAERRYPNHVFCDVEVVSVRSRP